MTVAICLTPEEWKVLDAIRTKMKVSGSVLLVAPEVSDRLVELGGTRPNSGLTTVDFYGSFDNEMQFLTFAGCREHIGEAQTREGLTSLLDDDFSKISYELRAVATAFGCVKE